jgi:hypothetical protein
MTMTAPLHHINQLILHLPALGGLVAGQVGAEEALRRQARLEEARNLHRDVVEVVAEAKAGAAIEPVHGGRERTGQKRRRPGQGQRADEFGPAEAVVDLRV